MSSTIDNRVVEMRFDNQQFESRVSTTMGTLEKLKNALKFEHAGSGLDELDKKVKNTNFSPLSSAVESVQVKFSALEVAALTALQNIVNRAVDAGIQLVKSLSVDQISAGFSEYELKMGSIQTIMASTGEDLETVNGYLDELNTYADKTIYSFSDMTSNIGKFTNAGVGLEDSVKAIQGVSNVAAVSGANANEASRAMYNFAQALSAGYVKLIDWKSIETANMSTKEFRQQLIDTAVAMGTLVKEGDKYVSTTTDMNGHVSEAFDATHMFNDSLSAQWMSTEVLVQALNNYSTDIRTMSKEEVAAYEEKLRAIGYTEEQIKEIEELGQKAFDAAQDVKTFSQLMDTLKESVGSGWAQTFEIIFGNFEESKALWTSVNEVVGAILQKQADSRNDMLKEWKAMGGRDMLMKSFVNIYEAFLKISEPVKRAFQEIFPPMTAQRLIDMTAHFRDFTKTLSVSNKTIGNIRKTFLGVFSAIALGWDVIKTVSGFLKDLLVPSIKSGSSSLLDFTAKLGVNIQTFREWVKEGDFIRKGLEAIQGLVTSGFSKIKAWFTSFKELPEVQEQIAKFKEKLEDFTTTIRENFPNAAAKFDEFRSSFKKLWQAKNFSEIGSMLKSFASTFKEDFLAAWERFKVSETFKPFADGITSFWNKVKGVFDSIVGKFKSFGDSLKDTRQKLSDSATKIGKSFSKIEGVFAPVADFLGKHLGDIIAALMILFTAKTLKKFVDGASKLAETCTTAIKLITSPFNAISGLMTEVKGALRSFSGAANAAKNALNALTLLEVVAAIGGLALIMVKLKDYKLSDFKTGAVVVGGIALVVMAILALIAKINANKAKIDPSVIKKQSNSMLKILELAWAVYLVVKAFVDVYTVVKDGNPGEAIAAAIGVVVAIGVLLGAMKILDSGKGIKNVTSLRSLIGVGITLKLIVSSFIDLYNVLSTANWDQMKWPLAAFGAAVVALGVLLAIISRTGSIKTKGLSMKTGGGVGTNLILTVISLKMLISVLKDLADPEFDLSGLKRNWKSIAVVISVLGALMLAISKMPAASAGAGAGLLAASAAIGILVIAIGAIGSMKMKTVQRGVGAVSLLLVFLGVFSLLSNALGKSASMKTAVNLLAVSASVAILAGVVVLLSLLNPEDVVIGTAAITALLFSVGAMMALSSIAKGLQLKQFAGLAWVIGVLTAAVVALGFMDPGAVVVGATALSTLMICVGFMAGLMSVCDNLKLGSFVGLSLVVLSLAGSIRLIGELESGVGKAVAAMAVMMILFGYLSKALATASTDFATAGPMGLVGIGLCIAVVGACAGIVYALSTLPNVDAAVQIALAMGVLMAAVGVAMQGVAEVAQIKDWSSLGVGLVGLIAVIGVIGAVIAGVTYLNNHVEGAQKALNEALPLFRDIGRAIGNVLGGLVEGFLGIDTTNLTTQLTTFGDGMKGFADSASGITDEAANGVKAIAAMLLALAGGDLLNAITNLLGGKVTTLTEFSAQLPAFGRNLGQFVRNLGANFNASNVTAAATAGKDLTKMVNSLPTSGGWKAKILGEPQTMEEFGTSLMTFSTVLKDFSSKDKGIGGLTKTDLDAIGLAAEAGQALIDLQGKLPDKDGFLQTILGEQTTLGEFATDLGLFGGAIKTLALDEKNGLKGLTEDQTDCIGVAAAAATQLVTLEEALPDEQGWFGKIFGGGQQDLKSFGDDAVAFAGSIKKAVDPTNGLGSLKDGDESCVEVAAKIVNKLKEFIGITSEGTTEFDSSKIADLGYDIEDFGESFNAFYDDIDDIDTTFLDSVVDGIVKLLSSLSDADTSSLGTLTTSLTTASAEAIAAFCNAFSLPENTSKVVLAMNTFIGTATATLGDHSKSFNDKGTESFENYMSGLSDSNRQKTATESIKRITSSIIGVLTTAESEFTDHGTNSFNNYIKQFQNKGTSAQTTVSSLVSDILSKFSTFEVSFTTKGKSAAQSFIDGIQEKANSGSASTAASSLASSALNALKGYDYSAKVEGSNFGVGFVNGIYSDVWGNSQGNKAYNAAYYIGQRAVAGLRAGIDAHSPSRKAGEAANDFGLGFITNLIAMATKVGSAATEMGDTAVNRLNEAVQKIPSMLTEDIDMSPVVSPIIDLSAAQKSAEELNGMFNRSVGITASMADVTGSSVAFAEKQKYLSSDQVNAQQAGPALNVQNHNEFKITSNNPEEVANRVSYILQKQVERKESVWGRSYGMGSLRVPSR